MSKILITGGAGFIGSHLCDEFIKNNEVIVMDNFLHGNKIAVEGVELVESDVLDLDLMLTVSKNCDTIIHLASGVGIDHTSKYATNVMEVDFFGTFNVCTAAKENNIPHIIYSSTSSVYGDNKTISPKSGYAQTKRNSEVYLENFSKETRIMSTVVRFFNVYGSRQDARMVVPKFRNWMKDNEDVIIHDDGEQTRDFTYIKDVTKCIRKILECKILDTYNLFEISRGKQETVNYLAKTMIKILKSKSSLIHEPTPEILQQMQVRERQGDSGPLYEKIKYRPKTNLIDGLKEML